jgi:hypothetical protein
MICVGIVLIQDVNIIVIKLKHGVIQKMKLRFRIGKRLIGVTVRFWNSNIHTRYGIENTTSDKKWIPFWDFKEGIELIDIAHDLSFVQDEFGLSTIYIIQSYPRASFRAFCLDKVEFKELIQILGSTQYIDMNYLRFLAIRRKNVIRIISKEGDSDRIICTLKEKSILREKSFSHAVIFSKAYNMDLKELLENQITIEPVKITLSKYESLR